MSLLPRTRSWLLVLVLIVIVAGYAFFKGGRSAAPPAPAAAAAPPQLLDIADSDLATAASGEISRLLRANGTLRAQNQAQVRAKVGGELLEVLPREGEHIAAGQLLARIDPSDYAARVKERIAALDAARSQAQLADATWRKNQELLAKGFISTLAHDNARAAAEVAAAQLRAQEAQLELAQKALADTQVHAPIAGWLAERAVQRGDKVNVDSKLFTLVDLTRLELEALVPASDSAALAVGQAFVTTVEGYGQRRFQGRVARIGPVTQTGNRYLPIYIELANADASLKAGLFAEGSLQLAQTRARALIPIAAVRSETGLAFVYVVDGDHLVRRSVELGVSNDAAGLVDVIKGVEPGNRVIAANLGALKDGQRIRLQAVRAAGAAR